MKRPPATKGLHRRQVYREERRTTLTPDAHVIPDVPAEAKPPQAEISHRVPGRETVREATAKPLAKLAARSAPGSRRVPPTSRRQILL
jgi:hypothetical protein